MEVLTGLGLGLGLFLLLQSSGEPVQAFVQSVTSGGATCLNVPKEQEEGGSEGRGKGVERREVREGR